MTNKGQPCDGPWGALEQLSGAAARYRITVAPLAGRKTMTLHSAGAASRDGVAVKALTAARDAPGAGARAPLDASLH